MTFSTRALVLDAPGEIERLCTRIRQVLARELHRRGAVIALSGGIDSSVVAALCARALGRERCLGLLLPERESSDTTRQLSRRMVQSLGIDFVETDITPILDAVGCYAERDAAIRSVVPDFEPTWKSKIVLPSVVDSDSLRLFSVVVQRPDGEEQKVRLPGDAYLRIVAATNFKQRARKMLEYFHADRLHYAVAGTPNLLEYDQGFFVKNGDGSADFKPIAHLYKTQVYQLAGALGVPDEIRLRPPTTDTYSLSQSQEEFYFSLPYDQMDLCLYARNQDVPAAAAAAALGLSAEQVERVYRDIDAKRKVAHYLHLPPVWMGEQAG